MVSDICIDSPLGKSDHSVIRFDFLAFTCTDYVKTRYTRKYDKADFKAMAEILDIDWQSVLPNKNIESQWNTFKVKLQAAVETCVPTVKVRTVEKINVIKLFI